MAPNRLKAQAATLADGCQRLRAHGAGRNGDLSRRQPPLLGNFQLFVGTNLGQYGIQQDRDALGQRGYQVKAYKKGGKLCST